MARALVKSRRFVCDTDHLIQQLRQAAPGPSAGSTATAGGAPGSGGANGKDVKYTKKPVPMMNYKSISKNFS